MLTRVKPMEMPLDLLAARMYETCGRFELTPAEGRKSARAFVHLEERCGLEMAHIAKDVQRSRRTEADIRANPGEHIFLIIQEEGQSLMQQAGQSTLMRPGDMVLIDSTQPSEFTIFGKYMRHLSVHLDRRELVDRFGNVAFGGHSILRDDQFAQALGAILASAFLPSTSAQQSAFLKEAVFGVLGAVLHREQPDIAAKGHGAEIGAAQVLQQAMAYIDRCFTDSELSPGSVAEALGVPIRNLQRAFAPTGVTPTDYLMRRRMERACQLLNDRRINNTGTLVSTIAFKCGFNDVSYFNRQFRKMFGCAPGQYPH